MLTATSARLRKPNSRNSGYHDKTAGNDRRVGGGVAGDLCRQGAGGTQFKAGPHEVIRKKRGDDPDEGRGETAHRNLHAPQRQRAAADVDVAHSLRRVGRSACLQPAVESGPALLRGWLCFCVPGYSREIWLGRK